MVLHFCWLRLLFCFKKFLTRQDLLLINTFWCIWWNISLFTIRSGVFIPGTRIFFRYSENLWGGQRRFLLDGQKCIRVFQSYFNLNFLLLHKIMFEKNTWTVETMAWAGSNTLIGWLAVNRASTRHPLYLLRTCVLDIFLVNLLRESDRSTRLSNKSRLFRRPNDSFPFFPLNQTDFVILWKHFIAMHLIRILLNNCLISSATQTCTRTSSKHRYMNVIVLLCLSFIKKMYFCLSW